jgi:zinc/manganese transport system substrate-binding protein
MTRPFWTLLVALLGLAPLAARAELSVFACEPEWQALAEAIGGDRVQAWSATSAAQDPHYVQARPSLIARLRRADLLFCSGAELEAGWLPVLLRRARNPAVLPGKPGHLMAADQVELLEIPERLDRSEGDIHAQGNPHVQLDPRRLLRIAQRLGERLALLDPAHADHYRTRLADFERRWQPAMADWQARGAALRGQRVVVHHREWIYLLDWLGLTRVDALEPKPGVPPAAGHLARLKAQLADTPVLAILRSPRNDPRPADWLGEQTGTPVLTLPNTVDAAEGPADLFALFDTLVAQLTATGRAP